MRVLPTVLTAVMLTGCQTAGTSLGPNILEVGYTQISPTSNVEVGHLYFSGKGHYPRFKTIEGEVFNEMCYEDYGKDRQLKRIDSYISERGKVRSEAIYDAKGNLYASANSGSIADLAGITLAGGLDSSTLFKLTNLRILSLSETGVHVIRQNIGKGCRAKIREFQADGRQVVLILEAQRADAASEIRVQGANANVGGSVGGTVADDKGKLSVKGKGASFGGGVRVSTTSKSNDLYVSVNLMDL